MRTWVLILGVALLSVLFIGAVIRYSHNSEHFLPFVRGNMPVASVTSLVTVVPQAVVTPQSYEPQTVVGAGDIAACNNPGSEATAKLVDVISGTVFTLGDNAYTDGSQTNFTNCFDPTWGRFKSRTRPATGNHEYYTAGAGAYFDYFGAAAGERGKGYYSYELGAWHIVVLNSNCSQVGGCNQGSLQEQWLQSDLAAHPAFCTLAYWHEPLFSAGPHGNATQMAPLWQDLYDAGAEIVMAGHDHDYERFAPQDAQGVADPQFGIREFVAGTGGESHYSILSPIANLEVYNDDTFGVLKLTLHATSYDWEFIPKQGRTFRDSGSDPCHPAPHG